MKTGIIIHSHTGNTLSVAQTLKDTLLAKGHDVTIERVTAVNEDPHSNTPVVLKDKPDVTPYDYIIFGAPVRAFSLSPVMKAYLAQLSTLDGKIIACFVTQQLKKTWMGGNKSIKQMRISIEKSNGAVSSTGIVNWSSKARSNQIEQITDTFCHI